MLTLIKFFFIDLLRLLQFFQTLKRLPVRQIFFYILPVRHCSTAQPYVALQEIEFLGKIRFFFGHQQCKICAKKVTQFRTIQISAKNQVKFNVKTPFYKSLFRQKQVKTKKRIDI